MIPRRSARCRLPRADSQQVRYRDKETADLRGMATDRMSAAHSAQYERAPLRFSDSFLQEPIWFDSFAISQCDLARPEAF